MRSFYGALFAAVAAASWPAAGLRADLAQASPFLPPNSPLAAGAAGASGPVELRGMAPGMAADGGIACCIYDTAKKTSVWVGLNEPGYDFVVKSADPAKETATVAYQGRSMDLVLRTAKVASAGMAQAGVPTGPGAANAVQIPTAADEQRRLDAVAAEVRRRRLEREKAFQTPGGPPPPAPNR